MEIDGWIDGYAPRLARTKSGDCPTVPPQVLSALQMLKVPHPAAASGCGGLKINISQCRGFQQEKCKFN